MALVLIDLDVCQFFILITKHGHLTTVNIQHLAGHVEFLTEPLLLCGRLLIFGGCCSLGDQVSRLAISQPESEGPIQRGDKSGSKPHTVAVDSRRHKQPRSRQQATPEHKADTHPAVFQNPKSLPAADPSTNLSRKTLPERDERGRFKPKTATHATAARTVDTPGIERLPFALWITDSTVTASRRVGRTPSFTTGVTAALAIELEEIVADTSPTLLLKVPA